MAIEARPIEERGHIRRTVEHHHGSLAAWAQHGRLVQRAVGILHCALIDYAELHFDQGPDATEAALLAHPVHGPVFGVQTLLQAPRHYNAGVCERGDEIAAYGQRDILLGLIEMQPYARVRHDFEAALAHRHMRLLHGHTAYLALAWLNAGHPNPRKLLEKPEIRAKFPDGLQLERFAAPDFDVAA